MTTPLPRFRCVMLRRSGATEIRIVRAESIEAARAACEAAGLNPVSIDPIGPSLFDSLGETLALREWRLPRWRPTLPAGIALPSHPTLIAVALILATVPITTALGAWSLTALNRWQANRVATAQAPAIAAYARVAAVESVRPRATAIMVAPTITAMVARLRAALPEEAGLAGLSRDEGGALTIEVETPDPDRLRSALAADPLLATLRNSGQTMTDGGTIMVILQGQAR